MISDFGTTVRWNQRLDSNINHPLIQVILKKIIFSENKYNVYNNESDKDVWKKYFPDMIGSNGAIEYVLHQTWYRPRDIVRLLRIGQKQFPYFQNFNQRVFDGIKEEYSRESWIEHTEELRTNYTPDDIEAIKKILYGISCPFDFSHFTLVAEKKGEMYPVVKDILEKKVPSEILTDLYRTGIIGNTGSLVRFASRGDNDILLENPIKVHNALWNYLSVVKK